jgi:hypothetical protein
MWAAWELMGWPLRGIAFRTALRPWRDRRPAAPVPGKQLPPLRLSAGWLCPSHLWLDPRVSKPAHRRTLRCRNPVSIANCASAAKCSGSSRFAKSVRRSSGRERAALNMCRPLCDEHYLTDGRSRLHSRMRFHRVRQRQPQPDLGPNDTLLDGREALFGHGFQCDSIANVMEQHRPH